MPTIEPAKAQESIRAAPAEVWKALTTPETIKKYMFGATVETDWQVGSPITWSGEFEGRPYQDKGEILVFDKEHVLQYTHYTPPSQETAVPDNHHIVTVTLTPEGTSTLVTLSQDNNETEEARLRSEKNWRVMLGKLKNLLESEAA